MEKSWWNKFTNKQFGIDADERRRRLTFYFISYVGAAIMLFFSLKHVGSTNYPLLTVLFGGVTLVLGNVLLSHRYPNNRVFYFVGGGLVVVLIFGLVFTGGYKNTGLYWVFPFYAVLFAMLGYRAGIAATVVSLLIVFYILSQPSLMLAEYPREHVTRFLGSLISFVCIIFIGEFFWHQSHSELATENIEKQRLANTDPLTKLPNRRFLDAVYFERAMQNTIDYFPLTTVVVDIDHFKKINDTYGHDMGDKVLVQFANLIKQEVRSSDIVARIGGEEFLILFPTTHLSLGVKLAEKIRQSIVDTPFNFDAINIDLSASFGVACALTDDKLNGAIKLADEHLYIAKQEGRNRVV